MDTMRIIRAARDIDEHTAALKWLEEFGNRLLDPGNAEIAITLRIAGSCNGAKEAKKVLEEMARFSLNKVVEDAVSNCRNTINICRKIIREESAK